MLAAIPKFSPWPLARAIAEGVGNYGAALREDTILGGDWVLLDNWTSYTADPNTKNITWKSIANSKGTVFPYTTDADNYPVLDARVLSEFNETLVVYENPNWVAKYGRYFAFDFLPDNFVFDKTGIPVTPERYLNDANAKVWSFDNAWNRDTYTLDDNRQVGIFDAKDNTGMCGGDNNGKGQFCLISSGVSNGYHYDGTTRKRIYVRKRPTFLNLVYAGGQQIVNYTPDAYGIRRVWGNSARARRAFQLDGAKSDLLSISGVIQTRVFPGDTVIGLAIRDWTSGSPTDEEFLGSFRITVSAINGGSNASVASSLRLNSDSKPYTVVFGAVVRFELLYDLRRNCLELWLDGSFFGILYDLKVPKDKLAYLGIACQYDNYLTNVRVRAKPYPEYKPEDKVLNQLTFDTVSMRDRGTGNRIVLGSGAQVATGNVNNRGALTTTTAGTGTFAIPTTLDLNQDFTIECCFNMSSLSSGNAGQLLGQWKNYANAIDNDNSWQLYLYSTGQISMLTRYEGATGSSSDGVALASPTSAWAYNKDQHVKVVRKGNNMAMILNGVVVAKATVPTGKKIAKATRPISNFWDTSGSNYFAIGRRWNICIKQSADSLAAQVPFKMLPDVKQPEFTLNVAIYGNLYGLIDGWKPGASTITSGSREVVRLNADGSAELLSIKNIVAQVEADPGQRLFIDLTQIAINATYAELLAAYPRVASTPRFQDTLRISGILPRNFNATYGSSTSGADMRYTWIPTQDEISVLKAQSNWTCSFA